MGDITGQIEGDTGEHTLPYQCDGVRLKMGHLDLQGGRKEVRASQASWVTCPPGEQQTAPALQPYLADGHSGERKLCIVYLESFLEFCWNSWEVLNGECLLLQCWEMALGGGMDEGGRR